jgi:hypothetical protein
LFRESAVTLARKGLRRISVDGIRYVWKLSIDRGFFTIVVELASDAGQRLEAQTRRDRHRGDAGSITPAGVAAVIRAAIGDGWQPTARKSPFRMTDIDARVRLDGSSPG